jgi:hypothetical protein
MMKNETEQIGQARLTMCRTSWKFSQKCENFPLTNPNHCAIIITETKRKGDTPNVEE